MESLIRPNYKILYILYFSKGNSKDIFDINFIKDKLFHKYLSRH